MRLSILIVFILALLCSNCQNKSTVIAPLVLIDFETDPLLQQDFIKLSGKAVPDYSFEGMQSFQLAEVGEPFVWNSYLHPGKIYKVSVWTNLRPGKNGIWLSAKIQHNGRKSLFAENTYSRVENGWYHLELLINTSWWDETQNVLLAIKAHKRPVIIDLFKVEEISGLTPEHSFMFNTNELVKVVEKRDSIIPYKLIQRRFKKRMPAHLNGETVDIKFKGDRRDHVLGGIWSLKTYSDVDITDGIKTLTFQSIKSRNFLKEWMYLRLCRDNGILAPSYDISTVAINDGSAYVCALEESFSDNFVYRRKGYDAPVLRLYEDHFLVKTDYSYQYGLVRSSNLANSYIYPYDKEIYLKGKGKQLYSSHAKILKSFINEPNIIDLIDKEKWAAYFAIQSLTRSFHNSSWHNSRWFINDRNLIEPVAYDGNTSDGQYESMYGGIFYGDLDQYLDSTASSVSSSLFQNKLFMSEEFMTIYKSKLLEFSDPIFIKEQLDELENDLELALDKVQAYYDYDYSTEYLFSNARAIREALPNLDNSGWYSKKNVFNDLNMEKDEVPYIPLFVKNFIRMYALENDSIMVINDVNQEVSISFSSGEDILVSGNSKTTLDLDPANNYFISIEGQSIQLPIIPWVPILR
ncbi:MAG: hypothetical protein HRT72_08935 [Flavobacteriales bacterium]|nr:hypothetical protein [Flavobacteriales bacterium]